MLSRASRTTLHRDLFNLCKVVQVVLKQHCRRFFPMQFGPKSIKTRFNRIFLGCIVVLSFKNNIARGFNLWKVVPWVLRHHCRRFSPVQSPNTSEATLHEKITCAVSTQSVYASFYRKIACEIAICTRQLPMPCWSTVHSPVNVV